MADICTLAAASWVTLQACYAPSICAVVGAPDKHGRHYCVTAMPVACPQQKPNWECKRPDGSRYELTQEEVRGDAR